MYKSTHICVLLAHVKDIDKRLIEMLCSTAVFHMVPFKIFFLCLSNPTCGHAKVKRRQGGGIEVT